MTANAADHAKDSGGSPFGESFQKDQGDSPMSCPMELHKARRREGMGLCSHCVGGEVLLPVTWDGSSKSNHRTGTHPFISHPCAEHRRWREMAPSDTEACFRDPTVSKHRLTGNKSCQKKCAVAL